MLLTDNIWLLGSLYMLTVHAQIQADINCDLFSPNRRCPLPNIKRLPFLRIPQIPAVPHDNYKPPWLYDPKIQASIPRDKRFLFYYTPSDALYANNLYLQQQLHMFRNKEKRIRDKPSKESDCPNRKTKKGKQNHSIKSKQKSPYYKNYNVPPVRLMPPTSTKDHYVTYQNNEMKNKKTKPVIYYDNSEEDSEEESAELKPEYVRDHAPEIQDEDSYELKSDKYKKTVFGKKANSYSELFPDGDRIEFQVQGHDGPKTYIFGFDTGDGNNRQYRLEERLKDGTVKGQYGYYDARGKFRTIKYIARPMEGYQEKHHETNLESQLA